MNMYGEPWKAVTSYSKAQFLHVPGRINEK